MIGAFPPLGHEAPSPSPREEFLEPIPGLDRELFQIMIRFPDQAAVAVERVDPQWLKSNSSRMLLAVYQELELAGRDLDMQTVMTTIESEGLKNLYVSLDEETPVPAEAVASQSFEDRFETLLTRYFEQVEAIDAVRSVSEIETNADSESQMRALGEMLAKLRTQHLPGRGDGPRRFSAEIHRG
jgi:DNA primase